MTKTTTSTDKSNHPSPTGEPGIFKYSYEALPPGYIRVLTLQPAGSSDENIVCELSSIGLDGDCQYTALFYVWGDVTQRAEIRCGNAITNITQSLRGALKRVRRMLSKPVAIWADAECIYQDRHRTKYCRNLRFEPLFRQWVGSAHLASLSSIHTHDLVWAP